MIDSTFVNVLRQCIMRSKNCNYYCYYYYYWPIPTMLCGCCAVDFG